MTRIAGRFAAPLACWLAAAGPAGAHAFRTDAGEYGYEAFLDGTNAVLSDVTVLVAAVACGLVLGFQPKRQAGTMLAILVASMMAGAALSRIGAATALAPAILTALGLALAIAWRPGLSSGLATGLLAVSGAAMAWTVFAGHPTGTIAAFAWPGALFALYVVAAAAGALVHISRERIVVPWLDIAWRAFASWVAAISVMVIAFALAAAG